GRCCCGCEKLWWLGLVSSRPGSLHRRHRHGRTKGSVSERPKEAVLKTVVRQPRTVGSNPTASAECRAPEHVAGSDAFGGVVVSGEANGGRNRILFRVKSIRLRPPLGKESGSARPGRAELSPGQTIPALVTPAPKPREPPAPRPREPPAPMPRKPPALPL